MQSNFKSCDKYDNMNNVVVNFIQPKTGKLQPSLRQGCCLAVLKPISGCVRIAYSGLVITSLLQVVNMLNCRFYLQAWCKLLQQLAAVLIFTDLTQLGHSNIFDATWWQTCIQSAKSTICICTHSINNSLALTSNTKVFLSRLKMCEENTIICPSLWKF